MHIRIATSLDRDDVRDVHLAAFADGEREIVSKLAINLLSEETTPVYWGPTALLITGILGSDRAIDHKIKDLSLNY